MDKIVYHIATMGDSWEKIVRRQLRYFKGQEIYSTIAGGEVSAVCEIANENNVTLNVIAETKLNEYEHPALEWLQENADGPGNTTYFHTKAVSNNSKLHRDWGLYLDLFLINQKKYNQNLKESDKNTTGLLFFIDKNKKYTYENMNPYNFNKNMSYYAGNFWIAKNEYLRSLPRYANIVKSNRYIAEYFLGAEDIRPLLINQKKPIVTIPELLKTISKAV